MANLFPMITAPLKKSTFTFNLHQKTDFHSVQGPLVSDYSTLFELTIWAKTLIDNRLSDLQSALNVPVENLKSLSLSHLSLSVICFNPANPTPLRVYTWVVIENTLKLESDNSEKSGKTVELYNLDEDPPTFELLTCTSEQVNLCANINIHPLLDEKKGS